MTVTTASRRNGERSICGMLACWISWPVRRLHQMSSSWRGLRNRDRLARRAMMKKEPENGRYTEDERARILNSFCRKPEVDPNVLLERIERAATFYQEWTAAKPYHSTKQSEIKRHFGRLQNAIRKLANEEQAAIRSPKDRDLSRRVDRRRAKIYASLRSMKE